MMFAIYMLHMHVHIHTHTGELKGSHMAPMFFNTLFNLNKFILAEQRDPIRIKQVHATPQLT